MDIKAFNEWMAAFMQPREKIGPLTENKVDFADGSYHYEARDVHGNTVAIYGDATRDILATVKESQFDKDFPL